MVFSSLIFLFAFLPLVLAVYFLSASRGRNAILLGASLVFYAWGETFFVVILILSAVVNHVLALGIERRAGTPAARRVLAAGIVVNLLPLAFFKYANFAVDNVNIVLAGSGLVPITLGPVHLPIGISFFTFQAISYIVDVYRGSGPAQPRVANTALYIALFPQLVAGPIVRYHDIARQLSERRVSLDDFRYGVIRFLIGLAKKVLIANVMGQAADHIFSLPASELDPGTAWLGAIAYTLQIYFDFSGYSDMAIGLGRMFGFRFLENFDFPYIAGSIREFWRRWHISLSNWFRDYVYVPLGGNRAAPARVYLNLVVVFFLTGLWHGASWNFIVWGMYHGAFLVLERTAFGDLLARLPALLRHIYVMLVVIIGWVFFRADDLGHALDYLTAMFAFHRPVYVDIYLVTALSREFMLMLAVGIVLAGMHRLPAVVRMLDAAAASAAGRGPLKSTLVAAGQSLTMLALFAYTVVHLAGSPHNPFLYFRF